MIFIAFKTKKEKFAYKIGLLRGKKIKLNRNNYQARKREMTFDVDDFFNASLSRTYEKIGFKK